MNSATNTIETVKKPGARQSITAQTIKPSNLPEELSANNISFKMIYVQDGRQIEAACTQAVYLKIRNEKLPMAVNSDFHLTIVNGCVEHINPVERESTMPGFKREEPTAATAEFGNQLVMTRTESGYVAQHVPSRVAAHTVNQVLELLGTKEPPRPGTQLVPGRLEVVEVRQRVDGDQVIIKP